MWIKTPNNKLINLEAVTAVQMAGMGNVMKNVILTLGCIQVNVDFKSAEEAQEYFKKMAAYFEAKEL